MAFISWVVSIRWGKLISMLYRFLQTSGLIFVIVSLSPQNGEGQARHDSVAVKIKWQSEGEVTVNDLRQLDGVSKNGVIRMAELETIIRRVLVNLQQQGFYFARIDSVMVAPPKSTATPEARVYLNSMPKVRLAAAVKSADAAAPIAELREGQNALRGKFDEEHLRQRLTEVLEDFARRGYPLAHFSFDSVKVAAAGKELLASLYLQFDPGPPVRIDSIVIRGNKLTKRSVLVRELPVRAGERFNLDKVQSIPDRLIRLGYLQSVAPPQLGIDAHGRYLLDLAVEEGNSNWLNGVAGYNPGDGKQKGYVTGLIDVKFGNLLGTGRQINARLEKRSRETQELALRYREPWVAGYPVHLSAGFNQRIEDTLYVQRRWDLTAEVTLAQTFTLAGSLIKESVAPDSLASANFGLERSRVTSAGAGLRFDSTDDPLNPRHGVFYTTSVETGRKTIDAVDSIKAQQFSREKIFIDFHWLLPIPAFLNKRNKGRSGQVLSMALHGRQVTSNQPEIPLPDQFRLGGATTLRGYREEQFRGSRIAWSNLEYRYLFSRRSRAFLFFDAGYYYRLEGVTASPPNPQKIEDIKVAWGLGVRVDTPLGIVGVDYGLGEGDPLTNGKVHVSLVNSF